MDEGRAFRNFQRRAGSMTPCDSLDILLGTVLVQPLAQLEISLQTRHEQWKKVSLRCRCRRRGTPLVVQVADHLHVFRPAKVDQRSLDVRSGSLSFHRFHECGF